MRGTPSRGKHNKNVVHIPCRRCGGHSYHVRKKKCSSCNYGFRSKLRNPNWIKKY